MRQWTGGEADRPLDVTGHEQARALGRTLPAFGPSRLLSAQGIRFSETIRPLGAELGLAIEDEPTLGDDEYTARPGRGMKRILELAGAGVTTAVCASGAVVRHLLDALAEDSGLALGEFPVGKGSTWALFFSGGLLAAADYYPAPISPLP